MTTKAQSLGVNASNRKENHLIKTIKKSKCFFIIRGITYCFLSILVKILQAFLFIFWLKLLLCIIKYLSNLISLLHLCDL